MARPQSSRAHTITTPITPGTVLGDKYVIEGVLGEGGMAFVMSARHRELDESVAIKFLKPGQQNEEIVRRFAREAKAMAKLRSQYIARVFDVGMSLEHGPYIVMELLHGENLGMLLHRLGALPERTSVDIVVQAAMALAEAHQRGIVHRDVKPENVFMHSPDGNLERATVKLVDFGVSKATLTGVTFGTSVEMAKTTTLVGSPLYMAPEQIRAREDVDHRADIWALGIVLYEMLTNESPFVAASIPELSAKILEARPKPLRALRPDAPEELEEIIQRCMAKAPEDRFQTMAELAEALAPYASPAYAHLALSIPTLSSSGDHPFSQTGEHSRQYLLSGVMAAQSASRSSSNGELKGTGGGSTKPASDTQNSPRTTRGAGTPAPRSESVPGEFSQTSHSSQPSQPSSSKGTMVAVGLALVALLGVGALLLRPAPQASAPPAAATQAEVRSAVPVEFRSEPAGATVEVDGAWRGVTPLKTDLTPGSHTIKLSMGGYEPNSMVVPVPSNGDVPPLPVVALKPAPSAASAPAAPEDKGSDKGGKGDKGARGGEAPAARAAPAAPAAPAAVAPAAATTTATPPTTPATNTATNRPRILEDKPHVKVID
ncbi:MAG: protein kinase [Polyangiaceae bacterium]|jgi:serine/threonine-protein kinase|nr:protein kinase [Polyangiaceae bacterium]